MTREIFGAMERWDAAGVATAGIRGNLLMRRSIFVLAATALGVLSLVGCDDFQSRSDDYAEAPPVEEQAPAAEDSAEPVVAPEVTDPVPTAPPVDTLPPDEKSSEQSVQPESETLFY